MPVQVPKFSNFSMANVLKSKADLRESRIRNDMLERTSKEQADILKRRADVQRIREMDMTNFNTLKRLNELGHYEEEDKLRATMVEKQQKSLSTWKSAAAELEATPEKDRDQAYKTKRAKLLELGLITGDMAPKEYSKAFMASLVTTAEHDLKVITRKSPGPDGTVLSEDVSNVNGVTTIGERYEDAPDRKARTGGAGGKAKEPFKISASESNSIARANANMIDNPNLAFNVTTGAVTGITGEEQLQLTALNDRTEEIMYEQNALGRTIGIGQAARQAQGEILEGTGREIPRIGPQNDVLNIGTVSPTLPASP